MVKILCHISLKILCHISLKIVCHIYGLLVLFWEISHNIYKRGWNSESIAVNIEGEYSVYLDKDWTFLPLVKHVQAVKYDDVGGELFLLKSVYLIY